LHRTAAVGHKFNFEMAGQGLVPVGKHANGDLLARLGGGPALLPVRCLAAHAGQQAVDRRRTDREEALADCGIKSQMAVLLQRRDEAGQDRLQSLTADPVRCFPEYDQGFAHRLVVGPSTNARRLGSRAAASEQSDGMLAMTPGHRYKLVQDFGLLLPGGLSVAFAQHLKNFALRRLADRLHRVPPEVGNMPLRQR
jgi:hypothetical protein